VFGVVEEEWELVGVSLVFAVIGLALGLTMWGLWGQKILVCPGGLVRQRGRRIDCCRWADIKEIVQKKGQASYRLVPHKGEAWTLNANHTQQVGQLIACIRQSTEKHAIHWKVDSGKSE
jgi:hypothetical protein